MIIFEAIVYNLEPLPKVRMTQGSKWNARSKRYLTYQNQLAWELKKQLPKNYKIYEGSVGIAFSIHTTNNRKSDIDNMVKGILDAIQLAGIVKNDNQVIEIQGNLQRGKEQACIMVRVQDNQGGKK